MDRTFVTLKYILSAPPLKHVLENHFWGNDTIIGSKHCGLLDFQLGSPQCFIYLYVWCPPLPREKSQVCQLTFLVNRVLQLFWQVVTQYKLYSPFGDLFGEIYLTSGKKITVDFFGRTMWSFWCFESEGSNKSCDFQFSLSIRIIYKTLLQASVRVFAERKRELPWMGVIAHGLGCWLKKWDKKKKVNCAPSFIVFWLWNFCDQMPHLSTSITCYLYGLYYQIMSPNKTKQNKIHPPLGCFWSDILPRQSE